MKPWLRNLLIAILVLLALGTGFGIRELQAQSQLAAAQQVTDQLIAELGVVQDDLTVVRNEKVTSDEALTRALKDSARLVDQLATMKAQVKNLRAIVRSQGMLEAPAPEVIRVPVDKPAPAHVFKTTDGLVVAELGVQEQNNQVDYTYTTHELQFTTSVVVTEDNTSVDVLVATSADPDNQIRVVQETRALVVPPKPTKLLKAQVSLGATAHLALRPELMGSLTLHWLHPHKAVDVLSPRVSGSGQTFAFGIDAVHYNIADPIPVIDNLWIGAGLNITHRGEWGGALTLGAKL